MQRSRNVDCRLEFHIVTEEDTSAAFQSLQDDFSITIHGVPHGFTPKKAVFKARALEWLRMTQHYKATDWILHLDEETYVDEYAIKTCIDVVERGTNISIAQGVILYNAHEYWSHSLTAYADCVRALDDFGRYQYQFNHVHRPIFGMHGAFLLVNGQVENVVTWDTENLTEDYWFALQVCHVS